MKQVCVIGEGAWGTAFATLLAANGYSVKLWCHDAAVCNTILRTRINERYLPTIVLSELIEPVTDLSQALQDVQWVFEAIPLQFLRSVLQKVGTHFNAQQRWVVLSKGIEQHSLLLPTQIINDIFGTGAITAVVAGPSFAHDLAIRHVTAVAVACDNNEITMQLQQMLSNDFFRPYGSSDMLGIQVGSALKNVIALGIGMLKGAGYTDNTQAFLFSRGLCEIARISNMLGGKSETVFGLSGVGDLVLTSMGALGRNVEVGKRLAQGQTVSSILKETGYIPEGINTVQSVYQLMHKYSLTLPICEGIYKIIFQNLSLQTMIEDLMRQPIEWES